LSLSVLYYSIEYAIRNVHENQAGLKSNGTHQLLAYTDDVNLLGDNIDTINKKHRNFTWCWQGCWSRNKRRENQVYVAVSSPDCRSRSLYKDTKQMVKYFGTSVTDQNLIQEEIKRLNSDNVFFHLIQNLLSSCLLCKDIKIRIYKSIIWLRFCMDVKCCI
jgi:hypothetical protein